MEESQDLTQTFWAEQNVTIDQLPHASSRQIRNLLSTLRHKAARSGWKAAREEHKNILNDVLTKISPENCDKNTLFFINKTLLLSRQRPKRNADGSINQSIMTIGVAEEGGVLSLPVRHQELDVAVLFLQNARPESPRPDMSLMADLFCQANDEMAYNIRHPNEQDSVIKNTEALRKMAITVLDLAHEKWPETATPAIATAISACLKNEKNAAIKKIGTQYLARHHNLPDQAPKPIIRGQKLNKWRSSLVHEAWRPRNPRIIPMVP